MEEINYVKSTINHSSNLHLNHNNKQRGWVPLIYFKIR